jgi:hypothetical protein
LLGLRLVFATVRKASLILAAVPLAARFDQLSGYIAGDVERLG